MIFDFEDRREDKHKPKGPWRHWTRWGTFEIKSAIANGILVYQLHFAGRLIDHSFEPATLVKAVRLGDYDSALGFPGASCELPASVSDWNNFR